MGQQYFRRPLNVTSPSTNTFAGSMSLTKKLNLSSGLDEVVQSATTNGTALNPFGVSTIIRKTSAGASTNLFTLAGAAIGTRKYVCCTNATSTRTCRVTLGAGVSFYSSNSTAATLRKATFNAANEGLFLFAVSTTKWFIQANVNGVAIATT